MDIVYLDNNATTQPAPEVVQAMNEMHEHHWANPSSVHRFGQSVRQRIELARQQLAQLLGCKPNELIFTSGGTESNNLALQGTLLQDGPQPRTLITTQIEHAAIREPAQALLKRNIHVDYAPVNSQGMVQLDALKKQLEHAVQDSPLVVLSLQWANNETGVIQPLEAVRDIITEIRQSEVVQANRRSILFHVDGTQAVGKLSVDVKAVGMDLMTLAAHKFHGPKGVGALYVRRGIRLLPVQIGGPQERERRGGTENTPAIVGMGVAAELAGQFLKDTVRIDELRNMRNLFEQQVREQYNDVQINSGNPDTPRLWNTSNLAFPRLEAEAILLGLSERGVCASAGAACSSGSLEPSPVLLAMGLPEPVAHGSVRFSMNRWTTAEELQQAVIAIKTVVERLSRTLPM